MMTKAQIYGISLPVWTFIVERVTGIEPVSRAWELLDLGRIEPLSSGFG